MFKKKLFFIFFSAVFLVAYSSFYFEFSDIFNSPDEAANYFFIKEIALNGNLFIAEPLNGFFFNSIHPRSIAYNGFSLVPQGFLGLALLFGAISKVLGVSVVIFITPTLAVISALYFFRIIRFFWSEKIALISYFLYLLFPVFWYYSARGLYPNVPFFALLIIALSLCLDGALKKSGAIWRLVCFSIIFSASVVIRPVEVVWTLPTVILFALMAGDFSLKKIMYAGFISFACFLPIFYAGQFFYGNAFSNGYVFSGEIYEGVFSVVKANVQRFFIFGFHPRAILENVKNFIIGFFPYFSIPAIAGVVLSVFREKDKRRRFWIFWSLTVFIWLIIFYGSGKFYDNPNFLRITFGDSHLRYWLPLFIFSLPYVAYFLEWFLKSVKHFRKILLLAFMIFYVAVSFYNVYYSLDDGLSYVRENLKNNLSAKEKAQTLISENDIIITFRQDKIFFPERKVLSAQNLRDEKLLTQIAKFRDTNFYYYTIGISAEEFSEMNIVLSDYGLGLAREAIFGKEVLYKILYL